MDHIIPKRMFFTKGAGFHKNKLQSFELALRDAGVERCNLVSVSSIFPPECKIISRAQGVKDLHSGQIAFVVMAREATNEPNRLVSAAIGLARPKDKAEYGYLSEHHAFGETGKKSADLAEDMAAMMLASTLGMELDPDTAWDERKQMFKLDKKFNIETRSTCQSAEGHKDGLWTTVVALGVFMLS